MYGQTGKLNFADITISENTDSQTIRGTLPNPLLDVTGGGRLNLRELTDNEFVTVMIEPATPVKGVTLPREAVMADQRGDFIYVVGADDKVERRPIRLG